MSQLLFFILDGKLDRVGGVRQTSVEHLLPAGRWLKLKLRGVNRRVWVCRDNNEPKHMYKHTNIRPHLLSTSSSHLETQGKNEVPADGRHPIEPAPCVWESQSQCRLPLHFPYLPDSTSHDCSHSDCSSDCYHCDCKWRNTPMKFTHTLHCKTMHLVGQLQAYINNMQMSYNSQTDLEAWCLVLVRIIMLIHSPEFGESPSWLSIALVKKVCTLVWSQKRLLSTSTMVGNDVWAVPYRLMASLCAFYMVLPTAAC